MGQDSGWYYGLMFRITAHSTSASRIGKRLVSLGGPGNTEMKGLSTSAKPQSRVPW
jgi:hypothetical protein